MDISSKMKFQRTSDLCSIHTERTIFNYNYGKGNYIAIKNIKHSATIEDKSFSQKSEGLHVE